MNEHMMVGMFIAFVVGLAAGFLLGITQLPLRQANNEDPDEDVDMDEFLASHTFRLSGKVKHSKLVDKDGNPITVRRLKYDEIRRRTDTKHGIGGL